MQGNDTSLQEVAGGNDVILLTEMLDSGAAVDSTDAHGCTALHFAADRGHPDIVQLLLSRGACVNHADSEGQTALHYAALCGHEQAGLAVVPDLQQHQTPRL